tara:strand:- start:464 stop:754 length:291 start_codon:yes stop_codon:yes gene_type:complete
VLIKLTEVLSPGAVLSEQKFLLREVFVNPEHVVMVREEARMRQLNEEGLLPDNLNLDHQFSKITINRGQTGTEIVVVGSPDLIETKLKANKKLLRG